MTAVVSFDRDEVAPLEIGSPGSTPEHQPRRDANRALQWSWAPAIISVSVNAIFLVAGWLPEFSRFPGREAALTQLWPLATAELTSAGGPVIAAQVGRTGVLPALLLITSLALPLLVRNPRWAVRVALPMATVYVGVVTWVVTLLGLVARGAVAQSWVGMVLLTAWVVTAGVTVWRSLWAPVEELPPRPTRVLWIVGLYALLYPVPLAMGRWLFTPELTGAAASLLDTDPTLRIAALNHGSTVPVYLSGLFVALTVWAVYMLVPPLQAPRFPWVRRNGPRMDALLARLIILLMCVSGLVVSGYQASEAGRQRAEQVRSGSPAADLQICASWFQSPAGQPVRSLIARGPQCRELTAYRGYDQVGGAELTTPLTPVRATMPDGRAITGKVVSAHYGAVVVLASSTRLDFLPEELVAVEFTTGRPLWSFRCDDDGSMTLRFAGADGGDQPSAGHVTGPAEKPSVVVECTNQPVQLDPATGLPVR